MDSEFESKCTDQKLRARGVKVYRHLGGMQLEFHDTAESKLKITNKWSK